MKGLEPPRLATLDPKSSASTNFATSAMNYPLNSGCKYTIFLISNNVFYFFCKVVCLTVKVAVSS